mgnify:CR=1 FL=1
MDTIPEIMAAVLLTGRGGFDRLEYRTDVPVPAQRNDEVLIKIGAAGVKNTDINTHIGWYSKRITSDTHAGAAEGSEKADDEDADWARAPLAFPRIQGADCCGRNVAVGEGVDK